MVESLYYTYKNVNSKYPFLALITDNIPIDKLKNLDNNNIPYKIIPYVGFKTIDGTRWNGTINKLYYLDLIEYDYIMFLDTDIFILEKLDDIFDKYINYNLDFIAGKHSKANLSCIMPGYLSGGSFIAKTGIITFNDIVEKYSKNENCSTDEQIISDIFFTKNNDKYYDMFLEDIQHKIYHDGGKQKFISTLNINPTFFEKINNKDLYNTLIFWNIYKTKIFSN